MFAHTEHGQIVCLVAFLMVVTMAGTAAEPQEREVANAVDRILGAFSGDAISGAEIHQRLTAQLQNLPRDITVKAVKKILCDHNEAFKTRSHMLALLREMDALDSAIVQRLASEVHDEGIVEYKRAQTLLMLVSSPSVRVVERTSLEALVNEFMFSGPPRIRRVALERGAVLGKEFEDKLLKVAEEEADLGLKGAALRGLTAYRVGKALPLLEHLASQLPRSSLEEQDALGSKVAWGLQQVGGAEYANTIITLLAASSSRSTKISCVGALVGVSDDVPGWVRQASNSKFWETASKEEQNKVIELSLIHI